MGRTSVVPRRIPMQTQAIITRRLIVRVQAHQGSKSASLLAQFTLSGLS